MGIMLVPQRFQKNLNGHAGFQSKDLSGMGIPGYTRRGRNYSMLGFTVPTPMGARYFPPEPDYDPDSDNPLPIAAGYKWNGGRPAYRERVYKAAVANPKGLGWKNEKQVEKELGPAAYMPGWETLRVGGASGMISHQFHLAAPGRERPDYTLISFPAANVSDTAGEEIELDQALSLAGRFGRDLLGIDTQGIPETMVTEYLAGTAADLEMQALVRLQTRTGALFSLSDPELLYRSRHLAAKNFITGTATDAFLNDLDITFYETIYGEPELYVAPRLFWRFDNDLDATVSADALDGRISSISKRLTFELFVELLERFADVTLL